MKKLNYKHILKYSSLIFSIAVFNSLVKGVPLSLSLLPGFLNSGFNPLATLLCFTLTIPFYFNLSSGYQLFLQALFLAAISYVYIKKQIKMRYESMLYLGITLLVYLFGNFEGNLYQKAIYSAIIGIFSIFSQQAISLVFINKFTKKADREQSFCACVFACIFLFGLINLLSVEIVYAVTVLLLMTACYLYKDSRAYAVAICLSIPIALKQKSFEIIAVYALYCLTALLFIERSKLMASLCAICVQTALTFISGALFTFELDSLLYCFLPFVLFLFLPEKLFNGIEKRVKKFDTPIILREIINEERAELSSKLYGLSTAFSNLNSSLSSFENLTLTSEKFIEKACDEIIFSVCTECNFWQKCAKSNKPNKKDLTKLINVGINKGKVGLIDLSRDFSNYCYSTNNMIFCINRLLEEQREHIKRTNDIQASKQFLTLQSNGIAEVFKNLAFEFSHPINFERKVEKEIFDFFAFKGIALKQVLKVGESFWLLFPYQKNDFIRCANLLSDKMGKKMRLNHKTVVKNGILAVYKPAPTFDACFGVAQKTKQGSDASGDTHSLTKIDENRFLVALCDGMGSGKNAFKNSQMAISLIESLFKVNLDSQACLQFTNEIVSLCSQESFCALDLITVDLQNAFANVMKIGAPLGFLITADGIKVIENNALPLGVMQEISPTVLSVELSDGDMFVLLSDGVSDAFFSSTDTVDFLQREKCSNPQTLADKLLCYAYDLNGGVAKDDMTAIVIKLYKQKNTA